jgi:hypothetical protein
LNSEKEVATKYLCLPKTLDVVEMLAQPSQIGTFYETEYEIYRGAFSKLNINKVPLQFFAFIAQVSLWCPVKIPVSQIMQTVSWLSEVWFLHSSKQLENMFASKVIAKQQWTHCQVAGFCSILF